MNTGILYPLTPQPIAIRTGTLSGNLFVDGNVADNLLLFRFKFDIAAATVPLRIQIKVLQDVYHYFCDIRDFSNPIMKTPVIKPEFSLKNEIKILKIESLVSNLT